MTPQIFQSIISVGFGLICFFALRTLKQIDKNQSILFKKHDELEESHNTLYREFSILKGEHTATHKAMP